MDSKLTINSVRVWLLNNVGPIYMDDVDVYCVHDDAVVLDWGSNSIEVQTIEQLEHDIAPYMDMLRGINY